MKSIAFIFLLLCFNTALIAQVSINISELEFLDKTSWSGSLMYVNYGDGKEVTLRTTMQIEIKGDKIVMNMQFTDEPGANSKSNIKLKKDGTYFGDEKIIERTNLEDGTLKIVTTFEGDDNNKPATMLKTYLIGKNEFSITKKVNFKNSDEALVRNRYTYSKV
ncbi:hypothetical protein N9954_03680 [Maribacter sp.]|nr:hypothetical protein [Maribacter sp.]